jgi:hypothetical protein
MFGGSVIKFSCTVVVDFRVANQPVASVIDIQGKSSGTGCAQSTKNTGGPFQDKCMPRAFFLSSLLKVEMSS